MEATFPAPSHPALVVRWLTDSRLTYFPFLLNIPAIGVITLTPEQNIAWQEHVERPELRCHLFCGTRAGEIPLVAQAL